MADSGMYMLDDLRCDHHDEHKNVKIEDSSTLSRWAWGLNLLMTNSLAKHPAVQDLRPADWKPTDMEIYQAQLEETLMRTKAPTTTTAAPGADMVDTSLINSDRPLVRPQHASFRDEDASIVTSRFNSRPIQDGGEKPSWGRIHPNKRPRAPLQHLV